MFRNVHSTIISHSGKSPKWPLIEWMNKLEYSYRESCIAMKKNKPLLYTMAWMNFTKVMLLKEARYKRIYTIWPYLHKVQNRKICIWNQIVDSIWEKRKMTGWHGAQAETSEMLVVFHFLTWVGAAFTLWKCFSLCDFDLSTFLHVSLSLIRNLF